MSCDTVEYAELESCFVCSRRFQTFAQFKKKKILKTFLVCGLEKLELIMRLLHLDSHGRGMLHVLKVSAVTDSPRGPVLSCLCGVKWMLL